VGDYVIFRSASGGFVPSPDTKIGDSHTNAYTDVSASAGFTYYYRVVAVDIHDNQSPPSDAVSLTVAANTAVQVQANWNLISVPITVTDYSKTVLYPTSTTSAFGYNGQYVADGVLANGKGYWLKFNGAQSVPFAGTERISDTIVVTEGWNLVGSISYPVPVSDVISIPPGLATSTFFGFAGSYATVDIIQPGIGYWVKVSQSGKIVLSKGTQAAGAAAIRISPTNERPPAPPVAERSDAAAGTPASYGLMQNYPNPFNPTTVIRYSLPVQELVSLTVYNILGQEVARIINEVQEPGEKSVAFDASALSSGTYTYRLTAGSFTQSRTMILLK
jgi:hypothetical protein